MTAKTELPLSLVPSLLIRLEETFPMGTHLERELEAKATFLTKFIPQTPILLVFCRLPHAIHPTIKLTSHQIRALSVFLDCAQLLHSLF